MMKASGPLVGNHSGMTFSRNRPFTGNGWAAAGMLRVLATIRESEYANTFKSEQGDLGKWVEEIHAAVYPHLVCKIIRYLHLVTNDLSGHHECVHQLRRPARLCVGELLRCLVHGLPRQHSVPRLAHARPKYLHSIRRTVAFSSTSALPTSNVTASFDGYQHLTSDGWLTPVVNPHSYGLEGNESAEAQAFVVQLHAAHRDWALYQYGSKSENSAKGLVVSGHAVAVAALVGSLVCCW